MKNDYKSKNHKKRLIRFLPLIIIFLELQLISPIYACSTFMLFQNNNLLVGHNLDQEFYTPGSIYLNRRGERKRSISCFDLELTDIETPILEWTSKYGSITFSPHGRNLPDGGMNEIGLTVSEMGLAESEFSFNSKHPTMLSHLWIQYQLDNYATVEEVLKHLHDINIEPSSTFTPPASSNYHLFVTDSQGNMAIIEFIEGDVKVYTNESAPVHALCNSTYQNELERLESYQGYFGWLKKFLDRRKDMRFVKCAEALKEVMEIKVSKPVNFCFDLLKSMQYAQSKQWSIVYDVRNMRIYFRTARGPNIRYFDFNAFDFSDNALPLMVQDIDKNIMGDFSDHFVGFTPEADRISIGRFLRSLVQFVAKTNDLEKMDDHMLKNYDMDVESYIDRALKFSELIRIKKE